MIYPAYMVGLRLSVIWQLWLKEFEKVLVLIMIEFCKRLNEIFVEIYLIYEYSLNLQATDAETKKKLLAEAMPKMEAAAGNIEARLVARGGQFMAGMYFSL